jgi:hypothetical protein
MSESDIDIKEISNDIFEGRAALTFAVAQFSDNPKLKMYKEDGDLFKLLDSLDDNDPFILEEMPPIDKVRQFLLFSKETKLPFGKDGVIQKQGNEEIAKHIVREQLDQYAEKFPWTKPMIDKGLKKAGTGCKGCSEKHLLQKVAQMVKDQLDKQGSAPTLEEMASDEDEEPTMWGAREPCPMCTIKHLSQAIVLMNESLTGYPTHRWYAIGHMAEAEAEAPSQEMANRIRMIRIETMDDLKFVPDFTELITDLDAIVRGNTVPEYPDH